MASLLQINLQIIVMPNQENIKVQQISPISTSEDIVSNTLKSSYLWLSYFATFFI